MRLDAKNIRHLTAEDWRVLSAVEQGSRNHEIVPTQMITSLSNLPSRTGVLKQIASLAKLNLISRVRNARYDGYRLTYGGLDYLALHAHLKANNIYSVGNQIGVGKEADIIVVAAPPRIYGETQVEKLVLKIHRLGRISFRSVKQNRDYLKNRTGGSWMYMSRLAAHKEFSFLTALYEHGFPVPRPVGWNRHTLVMEMIDALPLRQISSVPDPTELYAQLIELILRFASVGLIHGDFNEFNILIKEIEHEQESDTCNERTTSLRLAPIVIDFPQAVSTLHPNAEFYFDRDVDCIKRFFRRRFNFISDEAGPFFADAVLQAALPDATRLDALVEASGFSRKMAKELAEYMSTTGVSADVLDEDHVHHDGYNDDHDDEDDDRGSPGRHDIEQDNLLIDPCPMKTNSVPSSGTTSVMVSDTSTTTLLMETVTLDDIQKSSHIPGDVISVAKTAKSTRPASASAKVAKGWAI